MVSDKQGHEVIAAVDMGSNSFRLQVARVLEGQVYPLDNLKESVRLAAGLTPQKHLDEAAQERALAALGRFGERLRGFAPGTVRAVGTNALRVAKNAPQFLEKAEAALGFPIEVIAGREEARLIYVGVAHTLPDPSRQQLVVDIGGGSTEFIIGKSLKPLALESLYMGCVSYSMAHFPQGRVDKRNFAAAELAARRELQAIAQRYRETGWQEAVGSSGSAKALVDLLELNGLSQSGITRDGLEQLKSLLLKAGDASRLELSGVRPDRVPVLPGGLAIMLAVFKEFGLEHMLFSEGALRLGVLYDLVGRYQHQDQRQATVRQFMRRYQVEAGQARRVRDTSVSLLGQILPEVLDPDDGDGQFLRWAANLHELGISIAHSGYHKHSAYILANADMPGFSKMDQARLARLVLAHRGKLERVQGLEAKSRDWLLILVLRLAVLLHRARDGSRPPSLRLQRTATGFAIGADAGWLDESPLTAAALREELKQWAALGLPLVIESPAAASGGASRTG
ncbi:MAG: exopolyphosphatase [Rhodocyclaceae bacterium]|nr:exopolyphosphatase [Rhodocyclaceae bacterium]